MGEVLQEEAALMWILRGVTSPLIKPVAVWAPLYRTTVLPGKLLQCGFSGVTAACRAHLPALSWGSP